MIITKSLIQHSQSFFAYFCIFGEHLIILSLCLAVVVVVVVVVVAMVVVIVFLAHISIICNTKILYKFAISVLPAKEG
jgi:hypothetical protein